MQTIKVNPTKREELIEITGEVSRVIPDAGEGICVLVYTAYDVRFDDQ